MSWFGGGLSNIQGKLTSFTAQVLNDVVETVQGSGDADSSEETSSATVALEDFVALKTQHDHLMKKNHELEAQVATLSRQYRNLLSSAKGQSNAAEPDNELANAGGLDSGAHQDPCWTDLVKWLNSQGLVLPQSLSDRFLENLRNGTVAKTDLSNDEEQHKKCQMLEERIASLEQELESLDQQHQSALDVALATRDQLKEENRQLNVKIAQLELEVHNSAKILDTQTNYIQKETNENDSASHETVESDVIREDIRETLLKEIEKYKDSVSCLTAKLASLERVQQDNDALHSQLNQLSETISELALTHKTAETRLTEENVELQAKVTTLTNQNQILSSMTSVLDRITEENRVLETNLETVTNELRAKVVEVNKLRDEIETSAANLPCALPAVPAKEEKSTETEMSWHETNVEADDNQSNGEVNQESLDSKAQQLLGENDTLKQKLAELEKIHDDYKQCKLGLDQMSETCSTLQTELISTKEALRSAELRAENFADEHSKLVQKLEDLEAAAKANSQDETSSEIRTELAQLEEENGALKRKIEALENTQSDIHSHLNSLADVRQSLETELSQAKDEVERLRGNCSELQATNKKIETEFSALQSDLLSSNQTILSFKAELESMETEKISLREQLSTLQCQLDENARQLTSKDDAATEVNFCRDEMNKMSQKIAELESRTKEASDEKAQTEERAELERKNLLEELENANAAVKHVNLQLEENQREQEKLINELGAIREELRNSRSQADELAVKSEQQAHEIDRLNSETLAFQEALSAAKKTSAELIAKDQELHDVRESQTKALDELNHTLATVRQQYDLLVEETKNSADKESQASSLQLDQKQREIENLLESIDTVKSERDQFAAQLKENNNERDLLRDTLQAFQQQREQLVQTVQQKHQEAVNYHTETLRLAKICEDLQAKLNEKAKLEQEIHQLQTENDAIKANQGQWQAEMERLRTHLLSVEETYTQELLNSQSKEKALRDSLQAAEERANEQSRANDQLVSWQEKYRKSMAEKDRLEKEKMDQERSLERLQHALQQLTREKERDIVVAQKELLLKLAKAESVHNEKDAEITALRRKLGEAQQGLEAAGRLTQQLDRTKEALAAAKEQVAQAIESLQVQSPPMASITAKYQQTAVLPFNPEASNQEKELSRVRQQMEKLQSGTDTKVDKSLVKNLLIGYFAAPSAKQKQEVLRIVATVMDFSPEDRQKTGIEDSTGGLTGWASGILRSRTRTSSGNSSVGDADKSLSEAFINFLESESARPSTPRLPVQPPGENSPGAKATTSMTTFQPGRNEPTILRDILRDSES